MNKRNYKNPTVIAWEQLRQVLAQFTERIQNFDNMVQRQGRDIGVDEVFNEIQNIRGQLDKIQNGLNLYRNTINTDRVVDKSQPEIPFSITKTNESRKMNRKQTIRLNETQFNRLVNEIVKESVKNIIFEQSKDNGFQKVEQACKECNLLYRQYKSISKSLEQLEERMEEKYGDSLDYNAPYMGRALDFQKWAADALKQITDKINTAYGEDVITYGFGEYDDMISPFDVPWLYPCNDSWCDEDYGNSIIKAIQTGRPVKEFLDKIQQDYNKETERKKSIYDKESQEQVDYWKDKGIDAKPVGFNNSGLNYINVNGLEDNADNRFSYVDGKYVSSMLPKVYGKIDLSRESSKDVERRKKALNKK